MVVDGDDDDDDDCCGSAVGRKSLIVRRSNDSSREHERTFHLSFYYHRCVCSSSASRLRCEKKVVDKYFWLFLVFISEINAAAQLRFIFCLMITKIPIKQHYK